MDYPSNLHRVLLLRANDLGFDAKRTGRAAGNPHQRAGARTGQGVGAGGAGCRRL